MLVEERLKEAIEITKNIDKYVDEALKENKLLYISPESTGRLNINSDYRSKFYSLGVILFNLFTNKFPFFHKDDMQLIYAHIALSPPEITSIDTTLPKMLSKLISKLLSKNPDDRYQSNRGIIYDLELILKDVNKEFNLASKDIVTTLHISNKIYGRDIEFKKIINTIFNHQKELITIGGYSGIGKSTLTYKIREYIKDSDTYFVGAKFEQQKNNQNFNAISQALSLYIDSILLKSDSEIENFKELLLKDIGQNIGLMVDFIPKLKAIIKEEYKLSRLQPNEAQNRFNITFLKFIQSITSFSKKIILFIDDMQWSDVATIKMIELILNSDTISDISIILAFRSNEIKTTHPFSLMLNQFENMENLIKLELKPLMVDDIILMLEDTFFSEKRYLRLYAKLLKLKTGGNPFFIKEFLYNLYNENLIYFNHEKESWEWDIEKIEAINISENIVKLVTKKIDNSPEKIKYILKYASLMGSHFNIKDIANILDSDYEEFLNILRKEIKLNFIIRSSKFDFKFTHDKIQEAFSLYLDKTQKDEFHLKAGEYFLNKNTQIEQNIFTITDHLNSAKDLIKDRGLRYELIELNHKCAKKSINLNSYVNAIFYLNEAVNLQNEDRWVSDYEKTIELNTLLIEAYYLNLEFEKAKELYETTLLNIKDLKDKIKITQIEIFALIAQNKMPEALQLGLDILSELGITMPSSDDMGEYYPKLFGLYDVESIEKLKDLPKMEDVEKLNSIDILNSIMAPAYLTAPHIYPKICFVAIELCIKYGNSPASTNVYAVHALLLSAFFNEFKQSYEFSKLAQNLIEIYDAKAYSTKVEMIANACVIHWSDDVKKVLKPLRDSVMIGIEVGDFEYACYSGMYYTLYSLLSGKEIGALKDNFYEQTKLMSDLKQSYQLLYSSIWQEFLENLTTKKDDFLNLEGKFFSEKDSLKSLIESNSFSILYNIYFAKSMLGLIYEEIDEAYKFIKEAKNYHIGVASLYQFGEFYFYEAIIEYRYFKKNSDIKKSDLINLLTKAIEYYEMLSKNSPINNEHKIDLLKALLFELEANIKSWKYFESASKKANRNQFRHIEAIIYQLGFYYWQSEEMEDFAKTYLLNSYDSYKRWGANSVIGYLSKRYTFDLGFQNRDDVALDKFDLKSILKASHILAQELSLGELLKKVMSVIIENSASQIGFLFLENSHNLEMVAGFKDNKFITEINENRLPMQIINYVKRTKDDIIYSVSKDSYFIDKDEYILNNKPKSLFCTPILYKGEFRGILYLENRDTQNLYSKDKIEILRFLSNQASISLEHAKLFEEINRLNSTLEEQVKERTKELREQKETFERLFYDTSDGVLLLEDGKFIDCNSATLKMLKFNSKDELLNTHPSELSPEYQADGEKSFEKANKIIEKCLKEGSQRFEWIHKKSDGENFWVDVSLTTIKIGGKRAIHTLWKDISEQKELEEHLIEAREKAEIATKQKSEFLANMSHEIRTPMNGIIGMAHLALQSDLNDKQKNYIQKIDNSAKSLLGIINDILNFSKIEAGKVTIEKVDFDMFKVIDSVIGLVEFKAHEKNLELIVSYGTNIGKNFYGDPLRLSQILTNLMSNAVKFTSDGEIGIYIHKVGDSRYRFEVKDTGVGLTETQQAKLFKSFSQADGSTTREYGGTGLGLAISKQLVELMNGKIWVESEVGRGSSFIFEIELVKKEDSESSYNLFKDKRVLIVDDNQTWQNILYNLLKSFGIEADLVGSGEFAIEKISECEKHYDLILMDWNMPKLDGIETTKIIKDRCKAKVPPTVIMVSSFRQESIVKLARDIGVDIFLQKPINPSLLNDVLSGIFLNDIKITYTNHFENNSLKAELSTLNNSKILLAEDNSTNQEIILGLLESSGILIDIANNGKEAIEKFNQVDNYELILMDIQMPIMDGYEATKVIRDRDKNIPIIALTANAMKEDIQKTKNAGMNEHLNKPIDVEKLYSVLLKYISSKDSVVTNIPKKEKNDSLPEFKNIDSESGLKLMAGSVDLYLSILRDFVNNYKDLNLENLSEDEFARTTHSIKGLSANIGAKSLYEIAQEVEVSANKKLLPKFHEELKVVIDEIIEKVELNTKEKVENEEFITDEKRDELFAKLKDAIEMMQPKKCEPIIDEIEKYILNPKDKELVEKVKEAIEEFDFDEAEEVLKDIV